MKVIFDESHRGSRLIIGEVPRATLVGRVSVRQWSYRALINDEDVSSWVVFPGMKPAQILESARRFLDTRLELDPRRELVPR